MEQEMIAPNRFEIATRELSEYDLGKFEIPKEIPKKEESYYHIIGLKASDTANGLRKNITARVVIYNYASWERMQQQIKNKMFKSIANGQFNMVSILHNPTIKEVKPKGRPKADK